MKKIRKQIILVVSIVFLVLGVCSVAAVTEIPSDTGMNDVYVSPAGNDTSGDGTQANPYQTIGKGISEVNTGGTVHLADGIYPGAGNRGLTINKDVNIAGESQAGTVIDAQGADRIFTVNSGINVKIQNLTLENGNVASNGGAIANYGTLTVTDSTFNNNIATGSSYAEGGGAIYNSGALTVNSGTFMSNTADGGGAVLSNGGSVTITRSKFTNNKATHATYGGGGGAISIINTSMTVNDSTFTNNTSPNWYGGAIAKVLGTLTITGTTLKNNSALYGGAISSQGDYEIHFSTITGNTALKGSATYTYMATVNAENNWWGSNDDPRSIPNAIYAEASSFDADPYLKLNVNASPDSINPSESSTITADLTYNSNNQDTSSQGHVPNAIPVQFQTNLGTITSSSTTLNGIATATFQAGTTSGLATVQATVDSQTVTTPVQILSKEDIYVSPTGSDTTGTGTQSNPYQTIGKGISEVNTGGTVHLADGIYQGAGNKGLIITKNVNIVGQSQPGTAIDAQGADRIFTVNSGVTVKIQNLVFENGYSGYDGGAIENRGILNVSGCTFTGNKASGDGGAIHNDGSATIANSTFTDNTAQYGGTISSQYGTHTLSVTTSTFTGNTAQYGGAILNEFGGNILNVDSCTFTDNTAYQDSGAIDTGGYGSSSTFNNSKFTDNTANGRGGAIYNFGGTITVNSCTFTGNTAQYGGAIANPGTMNVKDSTFTENTASVDGGAIANMDSTVTIGGNAEVHFNRIIGNNPSNSEISNSAGTVNAQNNWWGSNDSPAGKVSGNVNYDPWLLLNITADPTTINTGETSQVTADLTHNSNNQDTSSQGHVPDGIPVQFQTNLGTITSSSTTLNGIATATLQAGATSGPANVQATVDSQTVGTTVTVGSANQAPVANAGDDQTVNHNDLVTLNGSGSSDTDGDTLTYSWTLTAPDGSSATLSDPTSANPTFTPDLPGTYTAQLTVTDNKGAVSSPDVVEVNALNRNPVANIGGPYQDNEGSAITFNAEASTDPDGDPLTYQWDLDGDGIFESTGQTVSKTWGDNYTSTVTLKVTDPYGGINTTSTTVTVKNVAPTATMDTVKQPDPFFILPTQNLIFNGSFTDPGWLDTHTATWNFGDGTTATANLTEENNAPDSTGTVTANHVYTNPGTYTVTLTVTDKDGGSSTATTQVKVISATDADIILNNYIQGLPALAFTKSASQQQKTISNKINEIDQKITAKDYNGALSRLSDLRDKSDSSLGGNPKNDWIKDPTAQKDIAKMIDDIIAYIKTL